jgi:amidase
VTVPFAFIPNAPGGGAGGGTGAGGGAAGAAFPEAFDPKPAPYGVSFTGLGCSEPKLIELAYAFEQATRKRVPPPAFP